MTGQGAADNSSPERGEVTFDDLALELQALRAEAGLPSYNEIVVRIATAREARGISADAARPARTTVYDAFRTGRRRLDPRLVGEIVVALGVDEAASRAWEQRVSRARKPSEPATGSVPTALPSPLPTPPEVKEPATQERPEAFPQRLSWRRTLAIGIGCLILNLIGRSLVDHFELPLHLDMVGTATAAIALGPWHGALVGLATNAASVPISGWASLPFAIVNVGGALVWGYGVHRFGLGRSLGRYFALNLLVAVCCTALAAPIIVALGGDTTHHTDTLIADLHASVGVFAASLLTVNLLMSVFDKLISGFVALVAAETWGRPILPGRHPAAAVSRAAGIADSRKPVTRAPTPNDSAGRAPDPNRGRSSP